MFDILGRLSPLSPFLFFFFFVRVQGTQLTHATHPRNAHAAVQMRLGSRGECYFMRTDSNRRTVAAVAGDTGVSSTPPPQTESLDSSVGARRPRAPPLAAIHASSTSTLHEQVRSLLRFLLASSRTALTRAHSHTLAHTSSSTNRQGMPTPGAAMGGSSSNLLGGLDGHSPSQQASGNNGPSKTSAFSAFPRERRMTTTALPTEDAPSLPRESLPGKHLSPSPSFSLLPAGFW